jgi:cytoskeletal protein CcmA (bactofilin family)
MLRAAVAVAHRARRANLFHPRQMRAGCGAIAIGGLRTGAYSFTAHQPIACQSSAPIGRHESPEAQAMNVLARISNPSAQPAELPNGPTPVRPREQHALGSPRAYSGPSIISGALTIVGRLESAGDLQIDGKVEGDIRGQNIRIGSASTIKGNIHGELVELAGKLEGRIEARSVVLAKTAHLSGDIIHQSLQIDDGAYFEGNSRPQHAK